MGQKLLRFVCFFLTIWGVFGTDCVHRDYGNGATVCVCNATNCDDLQPLSKTAKGVITSYLTSKSGDRFAQSQLSFSKSTPTHVAATLTVTLDPSKQYQKIIGFGGAFTDAAGINLAKLSPSLQTRLMADYYSADGIEYSLGRVPIGGSDFSPRPYTYDDHPGDDSLSKFALQPEDIKYKIPYLHLASKVSAHPINFFASPWSPPAWMKENNKLNNGGFLIGAPGEKYYKIWAKYFVKFLDAYAKQKITFWGITIQNEPEAGFDPDFKWNSLAYNATLMKDFTKLDLGPELHKAGYTKDKLKILFLDGQLPLAKQFADQFLADKEAAKYVSGLAFHWYWNAFANFDDLDDIHQNHPDYFLLATEACEEAAGLENHVSLGNWTVFNRYAVDIIKDLNHYTSGWTDWNLALDLQGGPNWVENFVDAPIIINATSQEYYKQPFFYALGHFSKFLLRDSVRIHQTVRNTDEANILVTSFQRPDGAIVVTILNKQAHGIIAQIHDPQNGYVDLNVKAESLQTLIWYN